MSSRLRSRGGCVTCKSKRQKCDETRPSCTRCQRANIPCGGYPKTELRWRTVNRIKSAGTKTGNKSRSSNRGPVSRNPQEDCEPAQPEGVSTEPLPDTSLGDECVASPAVLQTTFQTLDQVTSDPPANELLLMSPFDFSLNLDFFDPGDPTTQVGQEHIQEEQAVDEDEDTSQPSQPSPPSNTSHPSPPSSGYLLPFLWTSQDELRGPSKSNPIVAMTPSLSQLRPSNSATQTLMIHFDQQTCNILSINDGPSGNPWRTLISSLADQSRAVSHAISCMAAFHSSYDLPNLRLRGTEEMDESSKWLTTERERRFIPSLAASIALVFAEGWKSPKNTSNKHLGNTRRLIAERFPTEQGLWHLTTENTARVKYLVTAFVYVHVIAGITYRKEEHAHPLPEKVLRFLIPGSNGPITEIDPLLGCATSLFPLLDQVTLLVNKVRRAKSNSLTLVSQAGELHEQLLQWQAPKVNMLQSFGEHRYSLHHPIQTAEALRYATLLHLHQAVPEIPSDSSEDLAQATLLRLASIPSTSRLTNLHIFPLLAASCELVDEEDRDWAKQRWKAMILRLRVGNADACWEIVQATWARRDAYDIQRGSSDLNKNSELQGDYTVRGRLHWLNVMDDQEWQVFIG